MSFKVEEIGNFNPFEWDDLKCPVCGKNEFTSLSHSSIYCDYCNARFSVRYTCGDPGCVIDCYVEEEGRCINGPKFKCLDCNAEFGSLDEEPKCPEDVNHKVERVKGIFRSVKLPNDFPKIFYLILKTGDYCSGWMESGNIHNNLNHPTQEEWEEFQKTI